MKVAVSNLAWPPGQDALAAPLLRSAGVSGVELALTRYWDAPTNVVSSDLDELRRFWDGEGLRVCALQALLHGRPELRLFDADTRALVAHLEAMAGAAERIGAEVMVFGSPRQRRRGPLSPTDAWARAREVFAEVGEALVPHGVKLVIEPNPPVYECDFLTCIDEVARMVAEVGHPAVAAHLDVACVLLSGEDPVEAARVHGATVAHVHAAEPRLRPLSVGRSLDHAAAAAALRESGYSGWVSVEILCGKDPGLVDLMASARCAVGWYG